MDKKGEQNGILSYADKSGEFKRQTSQFRNWVSKESGAEFPAEKDRYHLCEPHRSSVRYLRIFG